MGQGFRLFRLGDIQVLRCHGITSGLAVLRDVLSGCRRRQPACKLRLVAAGYGSDTALALVIRFPAEWSAQV